MINAQINLVPLVFDQSTGKYKIFSISPNQFSPYSYDISEYLEIQNTLEHILQNCIHVEKTNHSFKLTDVTISSKIEITYIVFIMYDTKVTNGYLLNLEESIINEMPYNAKKIIQLL